MLWVLLTTVLWAVWVGGGLLKGVEGVPGVGGDISSSSSISLCPRPESYSGCSCYQFSDGLFVECTGVVGQRVSAILSAISHPIKTVNVYELDPSLKSLPPALFSRSRGILSLKISHSSLEHVGEDSLLGLESSLYSFSLMHSRLTAVPKAALHKLPRLRTLDLEGNNITQLHSYSFFNMTLISLNLKGNGLKLISEYAFEGLEDTLEELNLMNNKLKQLPIPALWRLVKLRSLQASANHISDVQSGGLSRLPALEALDLSNNRFTQVTSASLATMPALVSLSLYQNHIQQVAGDSFIHTAGLQRIYLSRNAIMNLAPETFRYTAGVKVIDLSHNHLHGISPGLFTNLPQLEELFLSHNNILKLSNHTFKNSTDLEYLYLQKNQLRSVESESFAGLTALYDLQLQYNKLVSLPPRLLTHTPGLNSLSLDHNHLTGLADGSFSKLTKLRELRLHSNRLSRVEQGLFTPLPNLQELYLQDNQINFVAKEAFSTLTSMQHLSLEGNRLKQLPDTLSRFPGMLVTLLYSKNEITTIHTDALRAQNKLQILWLNSNNLTSIQKILLQDLSYLQELYLQENKISYIQDKCFEGMKKLVLLQLGNNQLQRLTSLLFAGLTSLESLYLDNNLITDVEPGTFQKLPRLRHLDLSHNQLFHIRKYMLEGGLPVRSLMLSAAGIREIEPKTFSTLQELEDLDLSHNHIARVRKVVLNVPSIRSLSFSGNLLEMVNEDSLYDLPHLGSLDMSGCGLWRLPPHFLAEAYQLHTLNLANNNFSSIDPPFFRKMRSLREIDLSFNKFNNSIFRAVEGHTKLEVLKVNNNPLEELPLPLSDLPSVSSLNLSSTHLRRLVHTAITRLKNLRRLDMSQNRLYDLPLGLLAGVRLDYFSIADNSFSQIPSPVFRNGPVALKALNISGNPLRRLMDPALASAPTLGSLEVLDASRTNLSVLTNHDLILTPCLQTLDLSYASLEKVSATSLRNLTHLTHLNLAYNRLQLLPRERLRGVKALVHLNLTNNKLKRLDPLPAASHSLKTLDASGNKLMSIVETAFRHTINLETLLLNSNLITTIHPQTFTPLTALKHIDLTDNYLEQVDASLLQPLERSLEVVGLAGNPWKCGCGLSQLWAWLQDHLSYLPDPTKLTCHLPKTLKGRSFLELGSSMLCPQPLIVRLAAQDVSSQSLLLSWHASNQSTFRGFKVSFRETGEDGAVEGLINTRAVPSAAMRSYRLTGLNPKTSYLACVQALTPYPQTSHQPPPPPPPQSSTSQLAPDLSSKCVRVRTNEPPPDEIVLSNRLAIMIGVSLGIFIFFLAGSIICCRQICKDRREAEKEKMNNAHGNNQDFHSYTQFSVQENDASGNPANSQTEC